jgi:hypothetical protein
MYQSLFSHKLLEHCEYFIDNFLSKISYWPNLRQPNIWTTVEDKVHQTNCSADISMVTPGRSVYSNVAATSTQRWAQLTTDVRSPSPAPDIISSDTLHPIPHPRRRECLNAAVNLTWDISDYFGESCTSNFIMTNLRKARWLGHVWYETNT